MKKLLLLFLLVESVAEAQTVRADRFTFNTGPCVLRSGSGDPNGVVTGNVCDTYWRTDTGIIYTKISGTGNTGWATTGITGSGTADKVAKWTGTTSIGDSTITDVAGGNTTFASAGDLVVNPTGNDFYPTSNYDINLGLLTNKYLSLHAAELWVETLVAQATMATIGGRILVAPTTLLSVDLAPATTTITVKHNNLANGDRVYMESDSKVEFMAITSSAGGSAGAYTYTVTRNLDGTGANQWYAGDAILNTGTTGNGFIDLYSVRGVNSGTEIGPTVVGNVRTGTTFNQWEPRWAIGNLNGLYGYSGSNYGIAAGVPTGARVTVDSTNGIRIYGGDNDEKVTIDTSGNATFDGRITVGTGKNRVRNANCTVNTSDWILGSNTGLTVTFGGPWPIGGGGWNLGGVGSTPGFDNDCYISVAGTPAAGTISHIFSGGSDYANMFSIVAGTRYEASAYFGNHRSGNTYVYIQWFDSGGAYIGQTSNSSPACTAAHPGGQALSGYCRTGIIATAPTGAVLARPVFETTHTAEANPFLFIVQIYFGEASPAQEELSEWSPAGQTVIDNGLIRTNAIDTRTLAADSVTSAKIVAGTIVASDIATGTITATQIAASTITGTQIAGDAITAQHIGAGEVRASEIQAGTITADKMNVSSLSAISANLGTVTAGSITGVTININGSFIVFSNGDAEIEALSMGSAVVNDGFIVSGGNIFMNPLAGGSNQYVCVATSGQLYGCTTPAPEPEPAANAIPPVSSPEMAQRIQDLEAQVADLYAQLVALSAERKQR